MTTQMKFSLAGACVVGAAVIFIWSQMPSVADNHNGPLPVENWEPGICKPHCHRLRADQAAAAN